MSIVQNRKAFHDYFIEEKHQAGLVLEGWEVKSIRAGRAQLAEAYIVEQHGELTLIGAHISPLLSASTHINADPTRTRKLLMNRKEIDRLLEKKNQDGYTLLALNLHFSGGRIKLELGLAKGKKQHDKRESAKQKEVKREIDRAMKSQKRT